MHDLIFGLKIQHRYTISNIIFFLSNMYLWLCAVVAGGTDCARWLMISASPSPRQFLPSVLTARVSFSLPDRQASAALRQRMVPLHRSPQRDTLPEGF